ncbi:hypothetical protein [Verrucomicrobium sp. BvORR106]|uniref:hypothetical protein n=1 Tax=Verrucomicrobium sp. BvORR106 TaxID=1403819 RepID=UPI0005714FC1|nr:hypothetical protein [Verrucomicrobium sp. BvORR106]
MEYYYLNASGTPVGPMPWSAIRSLREARVILNETLVAAEGSDEWASYIVLITQGESPVVGSVATGAEASGESSPEANASVPGILKPLPVLAPVTLPLNTTATGTGTTGGASKGRNILLLGIFGVLVLLLLGTAGIAALLYFRGAAPTAETELASDDSGANTRGRGVPKVDPHESRHPRPDGAGGLPSGSSVASTPSPTPLASSNPAPGGAAVVTPPPAGTSDVTPTSPKVAPSNYRDPLAEWYDFGYRQGKSVLRVHETFGRPPVATRTQLYQLLKNLDVEPAAVKPDALEICMRGYSDGISGLEMVMTVPEGAITSILPQELRGYHTYKGGGRSR